MRGYAKDMAGNISYTHIRGHMIDSEVSLYEYYSIHDVLSGQSVDGVETAGVPLFYAILIAATALIISGDKCNTYFEANSDFLDLSCYVAGSIVVVGGIALTKGKVLKGATVPTSTVGLAAVAKGFSSKSSVQNLSTKLGASTDKVGRLGAQNIGENIIY